MLDKVTRRKVKGLVVNRPARPGESVEDIQAQKAALDLVARKSGFSNYQALTVHIWKRLIATAGQQLDAYPQVDGEIKSIVQRAVEAIQRGPRRPK